MVVGRGKSGYLMLMRLLRDRDLLQTLPQQRSCHRSPPSSWTSMSSDSAMFREIVIDLSAWGLGMYSHSDKRRGEAERGEQRSSGRFLLDNTNKISGRLRPTEEDSKYKNS